MDRAVIKGLSIDYSKVSDAWERGDPYEQYVGRWSRRVAPRFLSWLGIPAGRRWLDVGCGTGALCASILDHCLPISVAGVDPSEALLEKAKEQLAGRVMLQRGSAAEIPLCDASVDVTVSALVLNFVPNPHAALSEMARVTVSGGTIGAYVWDYAGKMDLMRFFWDDAIVGQFASRVVGNLGNGTVSFGPADRPDREMKDRHIMSEAFWLLGKKNGCPASGSEPFPQMAETHGHRGETPAMRKCASPFLQGSGSLAMFFQSGLLLRLDR